MWSHFCPVEKTPLSVGDGEACNWCGAQQRRADDPRIEQLMAEMAEVKATVKDVKDILGSFKIMLRIAKGCGVVAAACTAIIGLIVSVKTGWNTFLK